MVYTSEIFSFVNQYGPITIEELQREFPRVDVYAIVTILRNMNKVEAFFYGDKKYIKVKNND